MTLPALLIAAIVLTSVSGLLALAVPRRPALGQALACAALCAGAVLGSVAAVGALLAPVPPALTLPWGAPGGALALRLDGLSAFFLIPVLVVPALGSVYGLAYFPQARLGRKAVRLQILFGLVTGAMALVVTSANGMLFLAAWEVMALGCFFLVITHHEEREAQRAGFVYLASAHAANLALFAMFALLARLAGSFDFAAMTGLRAAWGPATAVFVLALAGFGLKAGLLPLHFWLPGAHAAAPSHVSALMSGVVLKTGIYGLLRVTGFFEAPPASWGALLLAGGAVSAVMGVAFALAQHDVKRLLAYHSVENIGIIVMAAGLALLGRARGDAALVFLGFAAAVLHVVNHATFKALLFLGAGAVVHATGTRDMDLLGGLARAMPRTAALFLVGAAAISGLPPLNGFASEWLVYLASLRTVYDLGPVPHPHFAALGAPVLAFVGSLAAACFVKVHGTVFLGHGRSRHAAAAHEARPAMLVPMLVLAAACVVIGLFPAALLPALAGAAAQWSRVAPEALVGPAASAGASAVRVSVTAAALAAVVLGAWLLRRHLLRRGPLGPPPQVETWGCGYSRPTARMQYTGSSLADALVGSFRWAFFPHRRVLPPRGVFPRRALYRATVPDTALERGIVPALAWTARMAGRARSRLLGAVQVQALLLAGGLVALLLWLALGGGAPW
ncbi:MAG TPA: proton-conducting transporter membrane subunit [Anaeromyxobacter sp.]|nr:proton-conducting transporter membrane subunit [Anaeromyxobacter sp.]